MPSIPDLGVMQGRLSPPRNGRIQSFPWHAWREEFARAAECGLQRIEWIFEAERWSDNPLATSDGQAELRRLEERTGVRVVSVCADYFLDLPLVRVDGHELEARVGMLKFLIRQVAGLGLEHMDLPLVDASACRDDRDVERVHQVVASCLPELEAARLQLLLETDLPPDRFRALLEGINHPLVGANHDIGNSASLGFDAAEELAALGACEGPRPRRRDRSPRDGRCGSAKESRLVAGPGVSGSAHPAGRPGR
jgi:hexulose-6-phosphate isomerase